MLTSINVMRENIPNFYMFKKMQRMRNFLELYGKKLQWRCSLMFEELQTYFVNISITSLQTITKSRYECNKSSLDSFWCPQFVCTTRSLQDAKKCRVEFIAFAILYFTCITTWLICLDYNCFQIQSLVMYYY